MKLTLECVILEITEKHFRNKENQEQTYYVAQAYQPGTGVAEIGIVKDVAGHEFKLGKSGIYGVEIRNGKPRIVEVIS